MKQLDERQASVFNRMMDDIQKQQLSLEEVNEIVEHVKHIFYTDGVIKKKD